jgi:Flp pilus assembly protein TadG
MRARRSLRSEDGTAVTEFGLIAPMFAMLLMGSLDVAHMLYMRAVLQGTVQKAARDSSLESGSVAANQTAIDTRIRRAVKHLNTSLADSSIVINRRYYKTFSKAASAQAETLLSDTNNNGTCESGDRYSDANNNNVWDRDGGDAGQGGARDITVYNVTVTYPHMFPLWQMLGIPRLNTANATTVIANQPYDKQAQYSTATARTC